MILEDDSVCVDNIAEQVILNLSLSNTLAILIRGPNDATPSWQINDLDLDLPDLNSNPSLLPSNLHSPTELQLQILLNKSTALFQNGQSLCLACYTLIASKSAPIPLRPTASQMHTVYSQWNDRLRSHKLRDLLIQLQGVGDLEGLLNDADLVPSDEIGAGAACMDPRARSRQGGGRGSWDIILLTRR